MSTVGRAVCALTLLVGALTLGVAPTSHLPAADAATVVANDHCRRYDPNLVRGACLRYQSRTGTSFTWIGSYRASNGKVFFCIDYLYDSRIAGRPTITSTRNLVNQLGRRVGGREVAALNYVISTWAARGSTGSNTRDAAIALIIRELMSDGIRPDGTVVYPRGLKVGERVRPPTGGLSGAIMTQAQQMWSRASAYRGPYRLRLTGPGTTPIELGTSRTVTVSVLSAAGRLVPGVLVPFTCTGPVRCPRPVRTATVPVKVRMTPYDVGESTITATASGPAADGRIYRVGGWRTHGGGTARNNGVQRGWIAERAATTARVRATAEIIKGTPRVTTRASSPTAAPGAALHDIVTVTELPKDYSQTVTATLYGPFPAQPGRGSCLDSEKAGSVTFVVDRNGDFRTPDIVVHEPGYYVWTETLPGDRWTNPVTTPCGIVEETTRIVAGTPVVRTRASTQHALVGRSIFDTVVVTGLGAGNKAVVAWTLHGPLAPRRGSCAGLDWSRAGVLARGKLVVTGDGRFRTPGTVLRVPGCVTYSETLAATATTVPVTSPPGLPSETALVTRPVLPVVPEIPSGPVRAGRHEGWR